MLSNREKFAGTFTIVRKLGSPGGQGQVFEVREDHGARWALKVLSVPRDNGDAVRSDLKREYEAVQRIRGEHVVQVVRWGVEDGDPWITMELLDGDTLGDRVEKQGPLEPSVARDVLQQLGLALAAAHQVGVIHRDVKPANVMLTKPEFGTVALKVKLVDFGIAAVIVAGQTRANETRGGLGSAEWMAPEQDIKGEPDESADVWAYALVAFYALTGKKYWKAKTGDAAMLERKLCEEKGFPIASERARELGVERALPPGFDDWFAKCVVYDPKHRGYHNAVEATPPLVALLNAWVASPAPDPPAPDPPAPDPPAPDPPAPDPPAPDPPAPDPPRREWPPLALGLGGLTVVAGLLAVWVHGCPPPPPPPGDAGDVPTVDAVDAVDAVDVVDVPIDTGPRCPPEMVFVPEGTFWMGSAPDAGPTNEQPRHQVHLHAFCIDRTEVTVGAYRAWRTQHPEVPEPTTVNWDGADHRIWDRFCNWRFTDREDHPINCVGWDQAREYCEAAGKRLPSEAEWEYAARGRFERRYPWGDTPLPDAQHLNGCGGETQRMFRRLGRTLNLNFTNNDRTLYPQDDGFESTAPVGRFDAGASPFGVLDMAGNVWEWTGGYYVTYPNAEAVVVTDPEPTPADTANATRVIRGGGWNNDDPAAVSASSRDDFARAHRYFDVGFRCARR